MGVNRDIELHIDEIVVEGLGDVDSTALGNAVQSELARLIAQMGTIGSRLATSQPTLNTSITLAPGADATAIGTQIARSIAGGLGK